MTTFEWQKKQIAIQNQPSGHGAPVDPVLPLSPSNVPATPGSAPSISGRCTGAAESHSEDVTFAEAPTRASDSGATERPDPDAEAWQMWSDLLERATLPINVGQILAAALGEPANAPAKATRLRPPGATRRRRRGWFLVVGSSAIALAVTVSVAWLVGAAAGRRDAHSPPTGEVALSTKGSHSLDNQPVPDQLHKRRESSGSRSGIGSSSGIPLQGSAHKSMAQLESTAPPWSDEIDANLTVLQECLYISTSEGIWSWDILSAYHQLEMLNQELTFETL